MPRTGPATAALLTLLWAGLAACLAVSDPTASSAAGGSLLTQERELLLQFKAGFSNWGRVQALWPLTGWDECSCATNCTPVCTWSGVECDPYNDHNGNYVTELHLGCNGCKEPLRGRLGSSMQQLGHLAVLHLHGNQLTGPLPPEWGQPGTFPELQEMDLSNNGLTGNLPDSWSTGPAFNALVDLQLGYNRLSGPFPALFASTTASFAKLMSFNFDGNDLTGTLPSHFNRASSLAVVSLHSNMFTGPVPPEWGGQGAYQGGTNDSWPLERLFLHGNDLTGGLPTAWARPGCFPGLQHLTLSDNPRLGSSLPPAWGADADALPALQDLNVSNCGLAGALPAEWGPGLQQLRFLDVTANRLNGSVPASWTQLSSLQEVTLQPGNPAVCGALPAGATFKLCRAGDALCLDSIELKSSNCQAPAVQGGCNCFPLATVVAPMAVGAVLAAAAGFWLGQRRRQQQQQQQEDQQKPQKPSPFAAAVDRPGHPHGGAYLLAQDPCMQDPESGLSCSASDVTQPPTSDDAAGLSRLHSSASSWLPARRSRSAAAELVPLPPGGAPAGGAAFLQGQAMQRASSAPVQPRPRFGTISLHPLRSGSLPLPTPPRTSSGNSGGGDGSHGGSQRHPGAVAAPASTGAAAAGAVVAVGGGSADGGGTHGCIEPQFTDRELQQLLLSDWHIRPEELHILKRPDGTDWQLGSGGFGTVFKALRNGVQPVAVKILGSFKGDVRKLMSDRDRALSERDFEREISILRACRDTNILQFMGACFEEDRTLLVTEYMEGGNLSHNLRAKKVSWWRRGKKIALDVARALVYLHSRRIVHLDIKSANVLLTRDGTAKVGDVGMAKIVAGDYISGAVGTLAWSAPELLLGQRCSFKADIFSFGVVLWEIATGEGPVRGQLRDPQVPEECPEEIVALMYRCLSPEPGARPSAIELVELLQQAPMVPPGGPISPFALASLLTSRQLTSGSIGTSVATSRRTSTDAAPSRQQARLAHLPPPHQQQQQPYHHHSTLLHTAMPPARSFGGAGSLGGGGAGSLGGGGGSRGSLVQEVSTPVTGTPSAGGVLGRASSSGRVRRFGGGSLNSVLEESMVLKAMAAVAADAPPGSDPVPAQPQAQQQPQQQQRQGSGGLGSGEQRPLALAPATSLTASSPFRQVQN